ncbi:E3 ubiquitin-protein ligase MARCHF6-like [Triticum dicoccoides]|uniref:E3 ubiquitin-protein ligase MARCHF6-like n=1 Tax=Triticum dicoccoides TaxID=85692 RepID=UPI00189028DA|nr:E3 ubiquitin-protein ligase MARCHF6-like [Triticum dicoccoides]
MGAAASAARETAGVGSGGEEQECRICRHPAEPERPLRHPCACRGTIRFVHDDCQLRWLDATRQRRCEVCGHEISIRPIYGADAPALARLASLILLPLCLVLTAKIVWMLTGLYLWRLALAGTRAEAFRLLTVRSCRPAALSQLVLWAENALGAKYGGRRGRCQVVALRVLQFSFLVALVDMVLACTLAFIPFTIGRIIRLCIGEVDSFASTPSILLIGYGFIFSLGATFTGLLHNTGGVFQRFARGFRALSDLVEQLWDFYVLDLCNYVVDERIVIGQRLEDVADGW